MIDPGARGLPPEMPAASGAVAAHADRVRPGAALLAGAVAIGINTALLAGMEAAGLRTAHGGLLRLLQQAGGAAADPLGLAGWWRGVLVPATSAPSFQFGFHVGVGLLMALAYAGVARRLPGRAWAKGSLCAAAVWLLNAAAVLPLIGEGFAGSRHLGIAGMAGFAAAHTAFFVLLAVAYGRLTDPSRARGRRETAHRSCPAGGAEPVGPARGWRPPSSARPGLTAPAARPRR